jgi:hypothetical protein
LELDGLFDDVGGFEAAFPGLPVFADRFLFAGWGLGDAPPAAFLDADLRLAMTGG